MLASTSSAPHQLTRSSHSLFWLGVVLGGAFFIYTRFFAKRGGQTLGGSSGGGAGEAVSFVKDMVIIGGVVGLVQLA